MTHVDAITKIIEARHNSYADRESARRLIREKTELLFEHDDRFWLTNFLFELAEKLDREVI